MGGSSEIAINVVPVIERAGGKVLVRADVKEIVVENGRAVGVTVARKSGTNCIKIGLPGKLIPIKRKSLREIIFSLK